MALLCNLHADGPATLRTLREGGCSSLEELATLPVERLCELLGFSPAEARRFQREGLSLCERVEGGLLEREDVRCVPSGAPSRPDTRRAIPSPADLRASERDLLGRVVERWREAELAEQVGGPDEPPPAGAAASERSEHSERAVAHRPSTQVRPEPAAGPYSEALRAAGPVPSPEAGPSLEPVPPSEPGAEERAGVPLRPASLPGLDEELCRRLRAAGVYTIEQLAELSADQLCEQCGLEFTRSRRLHFAARRRVRAHVLEPVAPRPRRAPAELPEALAAPVTPEPSVAPEEKISLAFPARPERAPAPEIPSPVELDAPGGPFA